MQDIYVPDYSIIELPARYCTSSSSLPLIVRAMDLNTCTHHNDSADLRHGECMVVLVRS